MLDGSQSEGNENQSSAEEAAEDEEALQENAININNAGAVRNEPRQALLNNVLCPCTETTEGDALLMCLALGMRHNLSWVALVDILKFANKLFGRKVVSSSKYFLLKYFDQLKEHDTAVVHVYCPKCEINIGVQNLNQEELVRVCECGAQVKLKGQNASYFVTVNLKKQFKTLMAKPEVAEEIMTHRFQRQKLKEENLEDIYDGEGYKKFCGENGLLSDSRNFSVTINTDGMDLGTSASRSAWPIFMYINELSPKNRKRHIIFAGIWVGKTSPNMSLFLKPFVDELKELADEGFHWHNRTGEEITSRVLPLLGIFDSAARYKLLNLSAYSGYYGCTFCYQRAEYIPKIGCRFTIVDPPAPLRTHESMMDNMLNFHNSTERNKKRKILQNKGCKGFSQLVTLHPYFNLGRGVIVDFMHNALLGVTRTLFMIFTDSFGKEYYLGDPEMKNILDERLKSIRVPNSITRTPREVKFAKKWKASEWRMFLIFYGLLCFDGLLPQKYFIHFAMLSSAFYLLIQKSVSYADIELADTYLRQFVFLTEEYFDKVSMVYNQHQLLHATAAAKDWGPLWGPNAFIFEGENRNLSQMNTSSGHVGIQLTRRYLTLAAFPELVIQYATTDAAIDFVQEIMEKSYKNYVLCDECLLAGNGKPKVLSAEELQCLEHAGLICDEDVMCFDRCIYGGTIYSTADYSRGKKNDDSWIRTNNGARGCIEHILQINVHGRSTVAFIMKTVVVEREPVLRDPLVTVTHLKRVDERGPLIVVTPSSITHQCIYFNLDTGNFICDIPYGCYGD